jgi:hypothetical protein
MGSLIGNDFLTRYDQGELVVDLLIENGHLFVGVRDTETGTYLAQWRDAEVERLFERGNFVNDVVGNDPRTLGERFRRSVVEYAEESERTL